MYPIIWSSHKIGSSWSNRGFPGLNSFFQGFVSKEKTISKLKIILDSLEHSNELVIMVTHQVTITAITGISVSSGGAVAFSTKFRESKEVNIFD